MTKKNILKRFQKVKKYSFYVFLIECIKDKLSKIYLNRKSNGQILFKVKLSQNRRLKQNRMMIEQFMPIDKKVEE